MGFRRYTVCNAGNGPASLNFERFEMARPKQFTQRVAKAITAAIAADSACVDAIRVLGRARGATEGGSMFWQRGKQNAPDACAALVSAVERVVGGVDAKAQIIDENVYLCDDGDAEYQVLLGYSNDAAVTRAGHALDMHDDRDVQISVRVKY